MPKVSKITHFFSKIFAIFQTAVRDKVDFVVDVNFDTIRLTLSYLMGVSGYAKCTQNNKYAIFLQYLKKEVVMKYTASWYYLFWWVWPGMPKVPRQVCNVFVILRKKLVIKFIFCRQLNILHKLTLSFLTSMTRHAQTTQNKLIYFFVPNCAGGRIKLQLATIKFAIRYN